jgi:hypothetical protein
MKHMIIVLALVLSACASAPVLTEVKIPIAEPCAVAVPTEPDYQFKSHPYSKDDPFTPVRDLLGDRELSLTYETELRVALMACK